MVGATRAWASAVTRYVPTLTIRSQQGSDAGDRKHPSTVLAFGRAASKGFRSPGTRRKRGSQMPLALAWFWWGGGILYAILLITAGVMTVRNGRWLLFVLGFFLPLLWIVGAFWDRPRYSDGTRV